MTSSDLWAIHQRKCKNGKMEVFLVAKLAMKSLLIGIGRYLCKVYNYHDSRVCGYKRSVILSRLGELDVEWLECFWCRSYGLM
jgi:hypothetical protein